LILDDVLSANHLEPIKHFIEHKDSYKEMSLPRRVMLLGNHAAGKSSLMHYIEQQQLSGSSKSTHGLEVKPVYLTDKKQDDQLPEAIFFDFGGQDYYHGIYRVFLRQHSSQIVLVNPKQNTNKTCDENSATVDNPQYTQDFSLDYWAAQLRYFQVDSEATAATQDTFLVQSHADLEPQQQWQYAQCLQDRLIRFDLLTLKSENTAKNPLALQHFRQSLVQHIQANPHTVFQTEKRAKQIQYILGFWQGGRQTFKPLAIDELNQKINGEKYPLSWFKLDLEQLSKAGLVWYDVNIANGEEVWLHPKGLVDHLYQQLLAPTRIRKATQQGILSQKALNDLKLHSATIELLEFYQIFFKHQLHKDDSKNVEYIIPNYLPLSKQDKALHNISTFGLEQPTFRLRFTHFMPMGLINQAICFFGCQPDDKLFWRDLMVFTLSEGLQGRYRVMLRLDFSQLEISVCIQPEQSSYKDTEYQKVKQYLFYCLLRFYWDLHANDGKPATFEHFVSIVINHDAEHPEDGWGNRFEQYRFHRPLWRKFYRDQSKHDKPSDELKFVPDDLYVSLGTDTWVHYRDLVKHPADETYIQRYQLESQPDQPTTFTVKGQTQAKPFEIFLNRELRAVKKIFISYSRKDVEYKDELALFLKTTLCRHGHEVWDCGMLEEGKWDEQIQNKLLEADLVILMLSINFFSSNYIVQHELLKTLERIDQGHSQQKMMCILVKTFPWDSFAQLAKHSKISPENLGQYQRAYLQEDVVQHQFLPYRKQVTSSINTENRELLVPLAKIHPNERDDVYSDIVGRVMKALDIAQ
jgi:internalin A